MEIRDYRDTEGMRQWQLLFEGMILVLLSEASPPPYSSELLAFSANDLKLAWRLSPRLGTERDHIANVWIKDGQLWAGSFSGFSQRINHASGDVLEEKFTR